MKKQEILNELNEKFADVKKKFKFKATYEEINEGFNIENAVLSAGFVSEDFLRQLVNKMAETFYSWVGVLHAWLVPPPYDMIFSNEKKEITDEERKEIMQVLSKIMFFVRKSKRVELEKNKKHQAKLIDELKTFNNDVFNPFIIRFSKKFEDFWLK